MVRMIMFITTLLHWTLESQKDKEKYLLKIVHLCTSNFDICV